MAWFITSGQISPSANNHGVVPLWYWGLDDATKIWRCGYFEMSNSGQGLSDRVLYKAFELSEVVLTSISPVIPGQINAVTMTHFQFRIRALGRRFSEQDRFYRDIWICFIWRGFWPIWGRIRVKYGHVTGHFYSFAYWLFNMQGGGVTIRIWRVRQEESIKGFS